MMNHGTGRGGNCSDGTRPHAAVSRFPVGAALAGPTMGASIRAATSRTPRFPKAGVPRTTALVPLCDGRAAGPHPPRSPWWPRRWIALPHHQTNHPTPPPTPPPLREAAASGWPKFCPGPETKLHLCDGEWWVVETLTIGRNPAAWFPGRRPQMKQATDRLVGNVSTDARRTPPPPFFFFGGAGR